MLQRKTVIAIMYDFDRTLCTTDMQEYSFIPDVNMKPEEFWKESNELAEGNKMDRILAYMYMMLKQARAKGKSICREEFVKLGKDIKFFDGVKDWFKRINDFGNEQNVKIEHYIISSGLREIIEGSEIYKYFREVFACEFYYDENKVACWPKNVVNYTTKTQFLFRVNKGVLDLSNDKDLNKFTPEENRPIPFRNMIYIGDGLTDVPCMKLVKTNGGYSIAVYKKGGEAKVKDLLMHGRVDFLSLANYKEKSELDKTVKNIICKMAIEDKLKKKNKSQLKGICE